MSVLEGPGMTETHRAFMRGRYVALRDRDRIVEAYAAAERRGAVVRRSNRHGIDPDEYARRLYADGARRGWLTTQ